MFMNSFQFIITCSLHIKQISNRNKINNKLKSICPKLLLTEHNFFFFIYYCLFILYLGFSSKTNEIIKNDLDKKLKVNHYQHMNFTGTCLRNRKKLESDF